MPHILRLPVLTSEAKKVVTKEQQRTYQDFPLRGHHFAAESQQAVQVAKVFDLSDEGKTLLEFPFPATRIALCNLWSEGKSEIFTLSCCSLICKIYSPKCIQFISLSYVAEQHGVLGSAAFRAEFLSGASVLRRHQVLGHGLAEDAGQTVAPPRFC